MLVEAEAVLMLVLVAQLVLVEAPLVQTLVLLLEVQPPIEVEAAVVAPE
jgi:hypothetical protein